MNSAVITDIREAIALVNERYFSYGTPDVNYGKYSQVFCFSNEDMVGYYDRLNLRGKKVLTVAGSGDQAINAILYGAKEVHCFDINRLTKYEIALKKAAILSLYLESLISFFPLDCNHDYLQRRMFNENVVSALRGDNALFWDTLFGTIDREKLRELFVGKRWNIHLLKQTIPYMAKDKYIELQSILYNYDFPFIESCITKLPQNLNNNKYDLILLSDIYREVVDETSKEQLEQFKQLILKLSSNLNPNGEIAYAYVRKYKRRSDWLESNGYNGNLSNIFSDNQRKIIHIDREDGDTDTAVLIYKKVA